MQSITYNAFDRNLANHTDRINRWIEISLLWFALFVIVALWR